MLGLRVKPKFAWAVQLLLTHYVVPFSSLPAHLCGVAAGLLQCYVVLPGAAWKSSRADSASQSLLVGGCSAYAV